MNKVHMNFNKFDMSKIDDTSIITMIAKRGSGKSILIKDLLQHKTNIPTIVIISPTEKDNRCYGEIAPDTFIYDKYDRKIIARIFDRQEYLRKKNMKRKKENKKPINRGIIIVMDDCMFDNKWVNDVLIRSIFMNGRHSKIMYILAMQFPLGITPTLRTNIDYVFLLHDNSHNNKKRLYEHYAGIFPNYKIFNKIFEELTINYKCMVIDNKIKSNRLEDVIHWYKADMSSKKNVCSSTIWNYHKKKYDKNYEDNNQHKGIDIANIPTKNNGNIVINLK
jgi:hypothetical protein